MNAAKLCSAVVAAALAFGCVSRAKADSDVIKLNGGLEARIASVGRDRSGNYVTVTFTLTNNGPNTVYLALMGPPPRAVDNAGANYQYSGGSGLPKCAVWNLIEQCIGIPNPTGSTIPLQGYAELDPGVSITPNFELFSSRNGTGTTISFAATVAYRVVRDAMDDAARSEDARRQQIRTMVLSFPPAIIPGAVR